MIWDDWTDNAIWLDLENLHWIISPHSPELSWMVVVGGSASSLVRLLGGSSALACSMFPSASQQQGKSAPLLPLHDGIHPMPSFPFRRAEHPHSRASACSPVLSTFILFRQRLKGMP